MDTTHLTVRKSLTSRLLSRILFSSALVIVLLAGGRCWYIYTSAIESVSSDLTIIGKSATWTLSAALSDRNQAMLDLQVGGLRNFAFISYVAVRNALGVVAESGTRRDSGVLDRVYPLSTFAHSEFVDLGVLHVQADSQAIMRHALDSALLGLAFDVMLILLVMGILFWQASSLISRPLAAMAQHFKTFKLGGASRPLALGKQQTGDELDVLTQAVNSMQEGLADSYAKLLETEKGLRESMVLAEAASLAKSEFLNNISHEIRTPLHGMLGMLQLMQMENTAKDRHQYVSGAMAAGNRLLNLLNDVLEFSKLERGQIELRATPFSIPRLFDSVSEVFHHPCAAKGLNLAFQLDSSVPAHMLGDEARLRQVLFNLVGNAVKFTETGEVRIEAWARPDGRRGSGKVRLYLSVADTGIGIPDDNVAYVFRRFTQHDGTTTREYEGAGLGLAIVKRIVDLMQGDIVVESEVGVGTAVHLHLLLGSSQPVSRTVCQARSNCESLEQTMPDALSSPQWPEAGAQGAAWAPGAIAEAGSSTAFTAV